MSKSSKVTLGVAIGIAIGAAIAYLSDRERREELYDTLSTSADRGRDALVEGYYEAKDKFYTYRDRLRKRSEEFIDGAADMADQVLHRVEDTTSEE